MTPPYVSGSDTSLSAAESVAPLTATMQEQVLVRIRQRGAIGATCDEIEENTGMSHQTASARIRDLVKAGAIVDSERRRPTRSGRKATVYVVRVST